MVDFNKVILAGNLTRDPEVRYTTNGTQVTNFGLAVNRKYRQGDEQKEETCFVDVSTFARQAELCAQYLKKGRAVLLEGRLQFRSWEDQQSGQRRSKLDVVAERVNFLGGRDQDNPQGSGHAQGGGIPPSHDIPPPTDDDIPFVFADTNLMPKDSLPFRA